MKEHKLKGLTVGSEHYKREHQALKNVIQGAKNRIEKVKQDYINKNTPFSDFPKKVSIRTKAGQYHSRVRNKIFITPEHFRFAFVTGFTISYDNIVIPILMKCKKNGEISKHADHFSDETESYKVV